MRLVLSACLLTAALNTASAEPARLEKGTVPSGPAQSAVEKWFTAGRNVTCSDGGSREGPCDLGRALAFRTFYDADGRDALAFVLYSASVSNGVSQAIGHFRRAGDGWSLVRNVRGVFGEGPDSLSFENGRAVFSMRALMPGDARCCLTGKQAYTVDLTTGAVKAGPRIPRAAAAPVSVSDTEGLAPRPASYQGATYFHNGSEVLVDERAGVIRYENPKASIRKAVGKGTLLFRGSFGRDGRVTGTAYVFKAGCEPASYPVSRWSKGSTIVLKGPAPHRDPASCAIVSANAAGVHATLKFDEYGDF